MGRLSSRVLGDVMERRGEPGDESHRTPPGTGLGKQVGRMGLTREGDEEDVGKRQSARHAAGPRGEGSFQWCWREKIGDRVVSTEEGTEYRCLKDLMSLETEFHGAFSAE